MTTHRLRWPSNVRQPAMPVTVTQMVRTPEEVIESFPVPSFDEQDRRLLEMWYWDPRLQNGEPIGWRHLRNDSDAVE